MFKGKALLQDWVAARASNSLVKQGMWRVGVLPEKQKENIGQRLANKQTQKLGDFHNTTILKKLGATTATESQEQYCGRPK